MARKGRDQYFKWAVPPKMKVPPDPLRLRLDFQEQAVVMQTFENGKVAVKMVSAMDVAHALASELSFSSGLLPPNTLWWTNTSRGAVIALWEEPRVRKLALQEAALAPPRRFTIPLPGLIFLCQPGQPPWVFAAKRRPARDTDTVYRAPLANVFQDGRTCGGNHRYPQNLAEIPDSFFRSFFSPAADLAKRSYMFPDNIVKLWAALDGQRVFPLDDLMIQSTVKELMDMKMGGRYAW